MRFVVEHRRLLSVVLLATLALAVGCSAGEDCPMAPACDDPNTHVEGDAILVVHRTARQTTREDGCPVTICESGPYEFAQVEDVALAGTEIELASIAREALVEDDWIVVLNGEDVHVGLLGPNAPPSLLCVRHLDRRPACVQLRGEESLGLVVFYDEEADPMLALGGPAAEQTLWTSLEE